MAEWNCIRWIRCHYAEQMNTTRNVHNLFSGLILAVRFNGQKPIKNWINLLRLNHLALVFIFKQYIARAIFFEITQCVILTLCFLFPFTGDTIRRFRKLDIANKIFAGTWFGYLRMPRWVWYNTIIVFLYNNIFYITFLSTNVVNTEPKMSMAFRLNIVGEYTILIGNLILLPKLLSST